MPRENVIGARLAALFERAEGSDVPTASTELGCSTARAYQWIQVEKNRGRLFSEIGRGANGSRSLRLEPVGSTREMVERRLARERAQVTAEAERATGSTVDPTLATLATSSMATSQAVGSAVGSTVGPVDYRAALGDTLRVVGLELAPSADRAGGETTVLVLEAPNGARFRVAV